jgi:hypothetical protein
MQITHAEKSRSGIFYVAYYVIIFGIHKVISMRLNHTNIKIINTVYDTFVNIFCTQLNEMFSVTDMVYDSTRAKSRKHF